MSKPSFHLGLCMAGSVSAGAYTAGVLDYLIEAIRNWEKAKSNSDITNVPHHDVVVDLLCGTSGGGMASAMTLFAMQDEELEHCRLQKNGEKYNQVKNNIFWHSWVEMTGQDVFSQMLQTGDIDRGYTPSAFNSTFIDEIADSFQQYVLDLSKRVNKHPRYLNEQAELFVTLFNVTGIRYKLYTKASGKTGEQYVTEHRDIAHFGWHDSYQGHGRMELNFTAENLDKHLNVLISAAKATGAFPVGLKARKLARKAKYIRQNPFFNYHNEFKHSDIDLGKCAENDEDIYLSINADGGTANNEPIELAQEVMRCIKEGHDEVHTNEALNNSTVILIDPFPSLAKEITRPKYHADHLPSYAVDLIGAMRSQLLFDAKKTLDIYRKRNYGLHLIAPSNDNVSIPEHAIACGALGGFGGLLSREFRVHDYFLGRHNCQSFLRKYLVVNLDELKIVDGKGTKEYQQVSAVIESYKANEDAVERFKYVKDGITWVPIIPDMTVRSHHDVTNRYMQEPTYKLKKLPENYLERYRDDMKDRYSALIKNIVKGKMKTDILLRLGSWFSKKKAVNAALEFIQEDLITRELMDGSIAAKSSTKENCSDEGPFKDM